MSTLTGNKISLTYKSLIKVSDNDVLTGALKELSDGLGNNSGVFLNTGGDLKSTGTLEFSNFKATAYAVTINKLVNEADGISNNDNDTSLPTSAAVKDYVDTHVTSQDLDFSDGTNVGAVDLDSQILAIVGTSNEIETSASGQQLQIGLPNNVTISGTFFATEFQGAFAGTINSGTTAVTQTAGDNSTKVATTAYVDTLDAASDLDFSDGSVSSAVNLNTQVFSIQGTSNEITTTASGQSLTIALNSTGVDLPDGSTAITQTAGDNSTKVATTAYVDTLDAASDLDIAGDTGTGDVNLNTQTLTLQGTTNQVITAVSGQTTTFSLPSTVHRDLQGNVTGNADTATAWQTARDLSISGEATGTLSSVDGTGNVSGAVTLTNSAVTGKVLTGLPTPAAATVQPSDSILEGIGKLQSQINGIANGLQFQGTWDAATNTPTLNSGGGEVDSGTTTGQTADKLIDSSQNFLTTVSVGDKVINQVDGQSALVTNVDSNTSLTLDADIMLSGEAYTIDASPFLVQGHYYVVSVGGTTSLNGNANWAVGDWVIAGADNVWSKLDHTQIDGQGTPGNLPVWNTATTLTDSIVSEIGTALIVTGSLTTTLGASITGDFVVNTNKFTVSSTTGNVAFPGDLVINTNKFSVSGTTGNTLVAGTLDVTGKTTFGDDITISDSTPILDFEDTDNTDNNWRMEARGSFGGFFFQSFDNNFQTGSTVLFAKYSNGYIGLGGNLNPQAQLDITGGLITSGNATFAGQVIASSSSSGDYVRMYGGSGTAQWDIYGNGENLRISENSGGGGHVDIDTNLVVDGNAGIGTQTLNTISGTNPTLTLGGTSISGGLILQRAGTDKARLYENAGNMVHQGMTGVGHHFYVNAATQAMVIDTSANATFAGIIKTTIADSDTVYADGSGNGTVFLYTNGTYTGFRQGTDKSFNIDTYNNNSYLNALKIRQDGTTTFAGNVDAATANLTGSLNIDSVLPTIKLTDTDTSAYARIRASNGGLLFEADENNTQADSNIRFEIDADEKMRIDSSGRVGINETSPDALLDIELTDTNTYDSSALNTATLIAQTFNTSNVNSQASVISLRTTGWAGGTTGVVNLAAIQAGNANSAHFVVQTRNAGTYGERMRITSSGVVQVKNQTPTIQLYNTDDGLGTNQILGDIDWYQIDPSADGVGTVARIRCQNISSFSGVGELSFQTGTATTLAERMRISHTGETTIKIIDDTFNDLTVLNLKRIWTTSVGNDRAHGITFSDTNATNAAIYADRTNSGANYNSDLVFITNTGASGTDTSEKMRIDSSGTTMITKTQVTSSFDTTSFLRLHPSNTVNSGGFTNMFFGTSELDNFGISLGGLRAGTNGVPTFIIKTHNNDATGTERMRITSTGNIEVTGGSYFNTSGITSIGKNGEFEFVDAQGSTTRRFRPNVDNSFDLGDSSYRWDDVWATNPTIQTSDRNEKNTIKDTDLGLDFINKLKPVSYKWNNKTRTHYGLIAQDVEDLLDEINKDSENFAGLIKSDVSEEKDNSKHLYGLRYNEFISPMIKAIQELKAEVDKLKQECKCK